MAIFSVKWMDSSNDEIFNLKTKMFAIIRNALSHIPIWLKKVIRINTIMAYRKADG